jgi:uncharacterized membrane protein (DUF106 family)
MAFLDPVLNPLFGALMSKSPLFVIIIVALIISLIITLVYKYMTNQELMKALKDEQKQYQQRIKGLRDQPEKMMALQKEAMSKNMKYMKQSFKPTLITFIPIILIFGWLAGSLAFEPVYPGETFDMTATFEKGISEAELVLDAGMEFVSTSQAIQETEKNQATWRLKSDEGLHTMSIKAGGDIEDKDVLITTELKYTPQMETYQHSSIKKIEIGYNKLRPLGEMSIFGWQPGWLGLYIIFSLIFSIGLRKVLKIY